MNRPTTAPYLRAVANPQPGHIEVESELVARAQRGDGQAWTRLYQDHFQRLYTDLMYLLDDAAAAEELCQETFAAALVSLPRFDGRCSFATWLRSVGHNLVRKHWRKHVRRGRAYERVSSEPPRTAADPEGRHLRDQRAKVLSEVLEGLPAALREVFVLRDVQGIEVDEVARRLQISEGNVRVRANRARNKIRAELAALGWLEGSPS